MPTTLTLAQARQSLWRYASNVDFSTATTQQKADVDSVINQVRERFITQGKWRGTIVRAEFAVYRNTFTLPDSLETALKIAPLDNEGRACAASLPFNQWYSILGTADPDAPGFCEPFDLGEGFATFRDPTGVFYIKAVADMAESGKTILLRGLDADGKVIYSSTNTEGVSLSVTNGAGATTSQAFSSLALWVKSAITNGQVRLYSVDVTSAEETLICVITPGKLVSNYRRYAVPWTNAEIVRVIAKRAYVPAVVDNDPLVPPNTGALKLGMMSLQYEDKNDFERAKESMNEAIGLLESDRQEFDGSHRTSFEFPVGYGPPAIPNLI